MRQDAKIVFIHRGSSWYLPYVLHQAKSVNRDTDVVLISDDVKPKDVTVEPLKELRSGNIDEFATNYLHMSTNPEKFEIFCWERWFYLLNYMHKCKIKSVLILDSDVLLYSSLEDICNTYDSGFVCGLSIPKQDHDTFYWAVSGHASYWTLDVLEEFCSFILNSFSSAHYLGLYKEKWNWHRSQNRAGGINDMSTLYMFWNVNVNRITNLAKAHNGCVFDHNINSADNFDANEYLTNGGVKKVSFVDGKPFLSKCGVKEMDRAHALHFQGRAKTHIRQFYTGGGFSGELYNGLKGKVFELLART